MDLAQRSTPRVRTEVALIIGLMLASIVVVVTGATVGEGSGGGHASLHALTSGVLFGLGLVILVRRPRPTLASRAPVVGIVALGSGTLVEGIGAFGFVGDARTDLAFVHDLGLGLSGLGMVAFVIGGAIGLHGLARQVLPGDPLGRTVATAIGLLALVGGFVIFATLAGFAPFPGS